MTKKKQPAVPPKSQPTYDARQRAERVLVSQGKAKGLLGSLPTELQAQLAAWCDERGNVLPAATGTAALLQDYYAKMKAVVEDDQTNEQEGTEKAEG